MTEAPLLARPGDTPEAALGRLRHVLDVCVALGAVSDLDRLLNHVLRAATAVLECEAASVLLYDEDEDVLRFAAATGDGAAALADIRVPVHGSLAGTILRENRPLLALDAERDERHFAPAAEAAGVQTRVLLGVPMRVDGQTIGVLEALNPRHGTFDRADVELLAVISAQAAVALRNARQREALETAFHQLEDLDRLKTNFMSIASHELRTPLTAVRGFGQMFLEESGDDLAPFAEALVRAGDRMMNVVETIDEMAALNDPEATFPKAVVDLNALLAEAVGGAGRFVALVRHDAPLPVEADRGRVALALGNLIQNAVQFTPAGGTVVVEADEAGGEATVSVRDTGRGIAAEDLERIFDAFFQVADPDTRDHEGLGVGLTVARSVASRHRGRLWAESEGLGRGATFHLRLPLAEAAASRPALAA